MEQENKPKTIKQAAKEKAFDMISTIHVNDSNFRHIIDTGRINGSLLLDISTIMHQFANWHASQNRYTEQKLIKSPQEILRSHLGSNGISLFDRLEYDHSHNSVLNCMHEYAKQFYTQEQMIAFGESVLKEAADRATTQTIRTWSGDQDGGTYQDINKETILSIDISKVLNK